MIISNLNAKKIAFGLVTMLYATQVHAVSDTLTCNEKVIIERLQKKILLVK